MLGFVPFIVYKLLGYNIDTGMLLPPYAVALGVDHTDQELDICIALVGSLAEPEVCSFAILAYTLARVVRVTEIDLGPGIAVVGPGPQVSNIVCWCWHPGREWECDQSN